ncbi:MAG: hypothetical protein HYR86_08060, partial [Candidatus Rokubacteria bacterium]|nr:hypothetical protein [Candidatus Rokubacteria bacterium]
MPATLPRIVWTTIVCALLLAAPASAGTIAGNVRYAGPAVEGAKIPVTIDQYVCGKEKEPEDLILSARKGVKNAVVYLQSPPPGA